MNPVHTLTYRKPKSITIDIIPKFMLIAKAMPAVTHFVLGLNLGLTIVYLT